MGKIYYMMGKSSSGKDTIYKEIRKDLPNLKTLTLYTTRPMREGEKNGVEYYFVTDDVLEKYDKSGKMIELRTYQTVYGDWKYATIDDGQINLDGKENYLALGTIEAYNKYCEYFGKDRVCPIYIEVDDGTRLRRALERECRQEKPQYREMCRRYIADEDDFSEENMRQCGITKRFVNDKLEDCIAEIREYIVQCSKQLDA